MNTMCVMIGLFLTFLGIMCGLSHGEYYTKTWKHNLLFAAIAATGLTLLIKFA